MVFNATFNNISVILFTGRTWDKVLFIYIVLCCRYISNLRTVEDDPDVDKWLEWESTQLQVCYVTFISLFHQFLAILWLPELKWRKAWSDLDIYFLYCFCYKTLLSDISELKWNTNLLQWLLVFRYDTFTTLPAYFYATRKMLFAGVSFEFTIQSDFKWKHLIAREKKNISNTYFTKVK
jgi:hypothetical protein